MEPVQTAKTVDGVVATSPLVTVPVPKPVLLSPLLKIKKLVLLMFGSIYGVYLLTLFGFLVILPNPRGLYEPLIPVGVGVSLLGVLGLAGGTLFLFLRIQKADVSLATRRRSLIKAVAVALPGCIFGIVTPFLIMREPSIGIKVTHPTRMEDMVAPLAVTLSAEEAVDVLKKRGMRPTLFRWDYEGDGRVNEETVLPVATALYEKQGLFTATLNIQLDDGTVRTLKRRISIPRAVFSVSPIRPIIERPVRFSIGHLVTKTDEIREAKWDYDGDGTVDETTKKPDVLHTYYVIGRFPVSATVQFSNQTQATFQRTIEVEEPAPLPFPITLISEPKNLIGPPPFGAIFRIETQEPLKDIHWVFGDSTEERGADLKRVGHSFNEPRVYPVVVKARSASGALAEITTLVRVMEILSLPDLSFEGQPKVTSSVIRGEAPVSIDLTARTSIPLVDFSWEAPNASNVYATGATLQAVYRKEGKYVVTLLAQNPEGKALRMPVSVEVVSPTAAPSIQANPAGGVAPLRVTFDGSDSFIPSGEEVAGFNWTFGDERGSTATSLGAARVEHVYTVPGKYVVTLKIVMISGAELTAQRTIIVGKPILDACIQASRVRGVHVGDGVRFDSICSAGSADSYLWDVRKESDRNVVLAQSAERVYAYVFEEPGNYTVSLTVKDSFGNQDTERLSILVEP